MPRILLHRLLSVALSLVATSVAVGQQNPNVIYSAPHADMSGAPCVYPGCPSPAKGPTPAAPYPINGVDSSWCRPHGGELHWNDRGPLPWQPYGQGEYVGPARCPHVDVYRIRPDDEIDVIYRVTRVANPTPYELTVGDVIRVESLTDEALNRQLVILPDGTISLPFLGQVPAAGKSVSQLRQLLEEEYEEFYNLPSIAVTPLEVNTRLEDLLATVTSPFNNGGQALNVRVTPEGTIQLPGIGSVCVLGMSLDEVRRELNLRYMQVVEGVEVQPVLRNRAPRYIYVLGEVAIPGRYQLEGPTTAMQAVALAGGWRIGGNLRQIVVFRRAADWRLMATKLDLQGALYAARPAPTDEIWLRDNDVLLVPKSPAQLTNDFIEMVFTRGIYGVVPFQGVSIGFAKASTL